MRENLHSIAFHYDIFLEMVFQKYQAHLNMDLLAS